MMNTAVVIVMSLAVVYAAPTTETAPMPCICTMDYRPVCGQDGVTYGNACGMKCAGVELAHAGECACICPKNLDPVCGSDGKTYGNKCMLQCAGAALMSMGSCDMARGSIDASAASEETTVATTAAPLPPCICAFIYLPVCGSDGVTYGNKCSLDCVSSTGVTLVSEGECPTNGSTRPPLGPGQGK